MNPGELVSIIAQAIRTTSQKTLKDPRYQERCTYSIWQVAKVYLLTTWLKISARQFYERLKGVPGFRRSNRLPNRLISLSQYKKRLHSPLFIRALRKLLREMASSTLRQLAPEEASTILMDLTSLHSDVRKDPLAGWGHDSRGLFYGYKLGLITTHRGVVLGMTLTRANSVEMHVQRQLQRYAREVLEQSGRLELPKYVIADSGFDGEKTYRARWELLRAQPLIPPKRRINPGSKFARQTERAAQRGTPLRWKALQTWKGNPERKRIYLRRNEIERLNSQLKGDQFRIGHIPRHTKGVRWMTRLLLAKLLIYSMSVNVNARRGRNLRRVIGSVA
jgi:hypothetical protein